METRCKIPGDESKSQPFALIERKLCCKTLHRMFPANESHETFALYRVLTIVWFFLISSIKLLLFGDCSKKVTYTKVLRNLRWEQKPCFWFWNDLGLERFFLFVWFFWRHFWICACRVRVCWGIKELRCFVFRRVQLLHYFCYFIQFSMKKMWSS